MVTYTGYVYQFRLINSLAVKVKQKMNNVITDQAPQNILLSGKISGQTSQHSVMSQITKLLPITSNLKESVAKISIEYEYNEKNLQSFMDSGHSS